MKNKINYISFHDELTNPYNRKYYNVLLEEINNKDNYNQVGHTPQIVTLSKKLGKRLIYQSIN
ncbi:hypothetical protein JCM16358_06440 [Halanaerocella petrolearia]